MIVWIDGTHGVGKSSVVSEIKAKLKNTEIEYIDSDSYRRILSCGGGATLQTNLTFLRLFEKHLDSMDTGESSFIVVEMAIPTSECKVYLLDPLKEKHHLIHFILFASQETLLEQINNDSGRDRHFAISHYASNMAFYAANYPDAIEIHTDHRSISEIADEVILKSGLGKMRL